MTSSHALLEITAAQHHVLIDLVYATPNNLTGRPVYRTARCLLHPDAEACLRKAAALAAPAGLRLKIFDAYRPPQAQEVLWRHLPDPRYVADIAQGSSHSRGVAIDVTLVDDEGRELDMGTDFDTMTDLSHHFHADVAAAAQRNRLLLLALMSEAGFRRIDSEWWHYELPDAAAYPLLSDDTLLLPSA